jgi:phytoene dehydrogenase-like protein
MSKKIKNLYYSGHYTHPGIGIPMVLISSQIVAKEIKERHG